MSFKITPQVIKIPNSFFHNIDHLQLISPPSMCFVISDEDWQLAVVSHKDIAWIFWYWWSHLKWLTLHVVTVIFWFFFCLLNIYVVFCVCVWISHLIRKIDVGDVKPSESRVESPPSKFTIINYFKAFIEARVINLHSTTLLPPINFSRSKVYSHLSFPIFFCFLFVCSLFIFICSYLLTNQRNNNTIWCD